MRKIYFLLLSISSLFAYGADVILFAEFSSREDARQTQQIIEKVLTQKHPGHHAYVQGSAGHYRVVSDAVNAREKPLIIQDVQRAFGITDEEESAATPQNALSATLQTTLGYDDNIYDHTRIKTTTYNRFTIDNNTTIVRDIFLENRAIFSHVYPVKTTPLSWNTSVSFLDQRYRNHSDINLRQFALAGGAGYAASRDSYLSLPFYFQRLWYGGSPYLNTVGFSPKYLFKSSEESTLSLELNLFRQYYIPTAKHDWNAHHTDIRLGIDLLAPSRVAANGQIGLIVQRRMQGGRTDVSYNGLFVSGRFQMPLWGSAYADMGFRFDRQSYLYKHPNLARREDTRLRIEAGWVQPLGDTFSAKINYAHIENISTIQAYTHRNNTVTFSLSASF